MLKPKSKKDAGNLAERIFKLDLPNQMIVDQSIRLLLASQSMHESEHNPPVQRAHESMM